MRDPFTHWTVRQLSPVEWGARIEYDQSIWQHPYRGPIPAPDPITDWKGYILHYWGGKTLAGGEGDPDLQWTAKEKAAYYLGRTKTTVRSGEQFHISPSGRAWRGLAYCGVFAPRLPVLLRARGFRHNGGQFGAQWNEHYIAFAWALGGTQAPSRGSLLAFARCWLEVPGPVLGHSDTGYDTACPGPVFTPWVHDRKFVEALGLMRYRPHRPSSRGPKVVSLTKRLTDLGYLEHPFRVYRPAVRAGVCEFQEHAGIRRDGVAGPDTYEALALEPVY